MGGRGSSGISYSNSGYEDIEVSGYKISDGVLYSPSGKSTPMSMYREISAVEKKRIESMGVKDPVAIGRLALSREIATQLQKENELQKENTKAAFAKNVPGLKELREAILYDENQRSSFRKSVNYGSGVTKGSMTTSAAAEVARKYPRANAYIVAEGWANSSNYIKSALGEEAKKAIARGKSYKKAISEMEKKWKKYTEGKRYD